MDTGWCEPTDNKQEADEAETVAMFQFHTWYAYPGGMNKTLPGFQDYENPGRIGGLIGGHITTALGTGIFGVLPGRRFEIASKVGKAMKEKKMGIFGIPSEEHSRNSHVGGSRAAETNRRNGTGIFGMTIAQRSEAGKKGGAIAIRKMPQEARVRGGKTVGTKTGPMQGKKNAESGLMDVARCMRWNVNRGGPCICGRHSNRSL